MRGSLFFETNLCLCSCIKDSLPEIKAKFVQIVEPVQKGSQKGRPIYKLFDFLLLHFHICKR